MTDVVEASGCDSRFVVKHRHENFRSGYVVLRIDDYDVPGVPKEQLISTKELSWSEAKAEAEAERLSAVNARTGARYFAMHVYVEPEPLQSDEDAVHPLAD